MSGARPCQARRTPFFIWAPLSNPIRRIAIPPGRMGASVPLHSQKSHLRALCSPATTYFGVRPSAATSLASIAHRSTVWLHRPFKMACHRTAAAVRKPACSLPNLHEKSPCRASPSYRRNGRSPHGSCGIPRQVSRETGFLSRPRKQSCPMRPSRLSRCPRAGECTRCRSAYLASCEGLASYLMVFDVFEVHPPPLRSTGMPAPPQTISATSSPTA